MVQVVPYPPWNVKTYRYYPILISSLPLFRFKQDISSDQAPDPGKESAFSGLSCKPFSHVARMMDFELGNARGKLVSFYRKLLQSQFSHAIMLLVSRHKLYYFPQVTPPPVRGDRCVERRSLRG